MQEYVILLNQDGGRAIIGNSRNQLKLGQINRYWVKNCCDSRQYMPTNATRCKNV